MRSGSWTEPSRDNSREETFATRQALLYRELYNYLTTAPADGTRPPLASAIDLPRPLARSLVHFYSLLKRETIAALDEALADQVALAAAGWFAALWDDLRFSAPTEDMMDIRPGTGELSPDRLEKNLKQAIHLWPDRVPQWETLLRHLALAERFGRTDSDLHRRALCRRYERLRRESLHRQRDLRREQAIRLVASPLADHLNELIPRLQDAQREVRKVFGTGGLWNILATEQPETDWAVLTRYRQYLEDAPGLLHLCERVMRGLDPSGIREVVLEHTVPGTRSVEEDLGLGEVDGITGGSGIVGTILPDLALLAFPETEELFDCKNCAGTLLQISHRRYSRTTVRTRETVKELVRRRRFRGRVVLCVDTSGSMRGTPEDVARATILGMVRAAVLARRAATILIYTDHLEELDLPIRGEDNPFPEGAQGDAPVAMTGTSPPVVPEHILARLSDLLRSNLADGTDIDPALERALSDLEGGDQGSLTDVVIVSDMRFPRLPPRHLNRMYNIQKNDLARFHCLTVNEEPLQDPLNVFDYRWFFNTGVVPSFSTADRRGPIGLDLLSFRGF